MEDYLHSLQKELKGFPPEEQAAMMEEVASHIESGERDESMGRDPDGRSNKLMRELGSPGDMGRGFQSIYRPNRLVDFLLVAVPLVLSLYLTEFYLTLRPQYPWMDIRINVVFDLLLIAVSYARRSVLLKVFWINFAIMQSFFIVLQGVWQPYWYFGMQTVVWAALLAALLVLYGFIVWQERRDALVMVFALLPLSMELLGNGLWNIEPASYALNPLDRSLLIVFLQLQHGNVQLYITLMSMALFFLASNRDLRWLALLLYGAMIGFGRVYLFDHETGSHVAFVASWVLYLYALLPLAIVGLGWWQDHRQRQQLRLAV